jgi:Holliday junction DNA helicase RuvA
MISFLKGTLALSTPSQLILEVNGVGYEAIISPATFAALPALNQSVMLHTAFVVRENSHTLFAFLTPEERNLFNSLLDVSGIGPKLALSLTGHLSPSELFGAIIRQDVKLLSKVPGIGKKTAERMILDLKDKASKLMGPSPQAYQIKSPLSQEADDAIMALVNLGYTSAAAEKAIEKVHQTTSEKLSLGSLITQSLKILSH